MIVISVIFSAIFAWIMAKHEEEKEKREEEKEKRELAWKLLALAAVEELYKQKKKREGEADEADNGKSD